MARAAGLSMNERRLPDCRPPRRDESITSAASHPELTTGDLAMRPRVHVPLTASDAATVSLWRRGVIAAWALVAVAFVAYASLSQRAELKEQTAAKDAPSCMQWHQAASGAVMRLAQSTLDAELRQINDAVFRIRRARQNCEEGWLSLACQDYDAVVRSVPGYAGSIDESLFACERMPGQVGRRTGLPK